MAVKSPRDREARRQQWPLERAVNHIAEKYGLTHDSASLIVTRVIMELWDCNGEMLQSGNMELLEGGNERDIWKAMLNRAMNGA